MIENLHIGIISSGRPDRVKPTMAHFEPYTLTWYIKPEDEEAYREQGAERIVLSGGLVASRSQALEDAFAQNKYCLEVSDDLVNMKEFDLREGKKRDKVIPAVDAVWELYTQLRHSPYYLAGIAPSANPMNYKKPVSHLNFILGDFLMSKPNPLRFDEQATLKEDYDYTAQHIKKYGGVVRVNYLLGGFTHKTNKGGAVDYRTLERENRVIEYLMTKHKGFFRRNPKREGEILFTLRAKRNE